MPVAHPVASQPRRIYPLPRHAAFATVRRTPPLSIPVQVLLNSGSLLAAVEEVQGRAGTVGGETAMWVLAGSDDPAWHPKIQAQLQAMLASRRSEGGYAQVLMADDWPAFLQLEAASRLPDPKQQCFARIGIVLADENQVGSGHNLPLSAVHLVPQTLALRWLQPAERERAVANMLGVVMDLARLKEARAHVQEFCQQFGGVRVTLAQAARFAAPTVQRVLARRLAARVADRMVQSLQAGRSASSRPNVPDLPEPPQQDIAAEIAKRTRDIGATIAKRIVGQGALPPEQDVAKRAEMALKTLPDQLDDLLKRHGNELRQTALDWQESLRRWSDDALQADSFAALPVLIDKLARWRQSNQANPLGSDETAARGEAKLEAPDDGQVRDAWRALARARETFDDSGVLFGGWALAVAWLAALCAYPAMHALSQWQLAAAGGAGMAVALCGWAIAALRQRMAKQTLARLEAAELACRDDYEQRWAGLIGDHVAKIGQHLHDRLLRFADEVAAHELTWLQTVHDALIDMQTQHKKPDRMRVMGDSSFDSDIALSEDFYAKAEQGTDPLEIFEPYDQQLRSANWRVHLEFVHSDALLGRCAKKYGHFAEQIPFADRAELQKAAEGPATRAMTLMWERLHELLPPELGADRFVVLPQQLENAVPDAGVGHQVLRYGLADIYAAVTRPVLANGAQ